MKTVFAYIGSGAGITSHTYRFAKRILEAARAKDPDLTWEITVSSELCLAPCKSCNQCFALGKCPQGEDIRPLLKKLEDADFVIFGSPVYLHNVSGDMMRFLERVSYLTKDMRLLGKYGMALSTNSNNAHTSVTSYLSRAMKFMGVYVAAEENAAIHAPMEFSDEGIMADKAEKLSGIITDCLNGRGPTETDDMMELIFKSTARTARSLEIINSHIFRSWQARGLFDYPTFGAFLADRGRSNA